MGFCHGFEEVFVNFFRAVTKPNRPSRKAHNGQQHRKCDKIRKDSHRKAGMSNRNEFSLGLGAKFFGQFADQGGTPDEANTLSENPTMMREVIAVVRGLGQIAIAKILQSVKRGIEISALTEPFAVAKHFVRNISNEAEVKISYLGSNFTSWFLNQVVPAHVAGKLDSARLTENSRDDRIMAEIGADKCETTLDAIYDLLKRQAKGEPGELLTNGYANIFYVRDSAGELRAVDVRWYGDGWGVRAYSVANPSEWGEGNQVFSRNSSVA